METQLCIDLVCLDSSSSVTTCDHREFEHTGLQAVSFWTFLLVGLQCSRCSHTWNGFEVCKSGTTCCAPWRATFARNLGTIVAVLHLLRPLRSLDHLGCGLYGPESRKSPRSVARQSYLRAFGSTASPPSRQGWSATIVAIRENLRWCQGINCESRAGQMLQEAIACFPGDPRPVVTVLNLPHSGIYGTTTSRALSIVAWDT